MLKMLISFCKFVWLQTLSHLLVFIICKVKWRTEEVIQRIQFPVQSLPQTVHLLNQKVYKTKFLLHKLGPPVYWVCAGSFAFSVSFLLNFSFYQFCVPQELLLAAIYPLL